MRISIHFVYQVILFSIVGIVTAFSQTDPKNDGAFEMLDARTGSVETDHYSIRFELPWRHRRPAPEEIGAMLEQYHAVMDRYFGKPIAQQKSKILGSDAADETEKAGGKKKADKKKAATETANPAKSDPKDKIRIYMMNDREEYARLLEEHALLKDWLENMGGVYFGSKKAIYTYRSANLLSTRSTLLHEATHAYHDKYFPGAFRAYPDWFQECFAKHFEDHSWNGKQLRLDGMPPFTRRKYAENAIPVLLDFRDWIKAKQGVPPAATADAGETEPKKGRVKKTGSSTAAAETVIDFALIQPYIDEKYNFRKADEKGRESAVDKAYTLYWTLGKYLFRERREALVVVLVAMSGDPRLIDKKNVRATREAFYAAFAKAFAEKPLTIEAIGRWLQKNPLDWEYVFSEWQFTDEAFLARVAPEDPSRSGVAMLVYNAKGKMPPFVVRPTRGDCSPGIVLDFVDPKNFQLLRVQSNGRISHNAKINGTWDTSKIVGSIGGPVSGELRFAARQLGEAVEVSINGQSVYRGPCSPRNRFGMYLQGKNAEAAFIPK